MCTKNDFRSRVARFRKLAAAAKVHEAVLPSLAGFRTALEKAVEEIDSTKRRQQNLEQLRLEATDQLWDHVAAGHELSVRLKSYVRASFGPNDQRLAAFDIPIRGRSGKPPEPAKKNGSPGSH